MNEQKLKILTREEAIDLLDNQIEYTFQLEKQNKELHNKIDKAIEYINIVAMATNKPQYFQKIKDTIWGEELLEILKDSDVDE